MSEQKTISSEEIREILQTGESQAIQKALEGVPPADIADIIDELTAEEKVAVFDALDAQAAADVLSEADVESQEEILEESEPDHVVEVLDQLPPDDAADVLATVSEEEAHKLLGKMKPDGAEVVERLMEYPPDSAGGKMTTDFVVFYEGLSARDAIRITQESVETESISYLYVADSMDRLVGVLPLRKLVFADPQTLIRDIMDTDLITVTVDTDQEEAAQIVRKYNLLSLPVVDSDGRLQGVITVDDVIDAIEEEASEDMYKLAGTSEKSPIRESIMRKTRLRLPWLLVTFVGGVICCNVVGRFQGQISQVVSLAFFLPLIPLMGGNVGIQASTIIVRGLATGDIGGKQLFKSIFREILVGIVLGVVCGLATGLAAFTMEATGIIQSELPIGRIIGLAVLGAISLSSTLGSTVPVIFQRLGVDPALAAGPFVTILNDISGVTIYLGLATLLMRRLG